MISLPMCDVFRKHKSPILQLGGQQFNSALMLTYPELAQTLWVRGSVPDREEGERERLCLWCHHLHQQMAVGDMPEVLEQVEGLVGWPAVLVGINTSIMTQQKEMGLLHEWCLFFTMYNSWVFYSFYWMCFRKWSICLFAFQELSDNMAFLMPCSIFLYFFSFLHFILKFCQQKNGEVTVICKMFYGMSYS